MAKAFGIADLKTKQLEKWCAANKVKPEAKDGRHSFLTNSLSQLEDRWNAANPAGHAETVNDKAQTVEEIRASIGLTEKPGDENTQHLKDLWSFTEFLAKGDK